ncbi:M20/M25/M40 family metallo-hydrolase [uncultured Clostridium sp.]|uniref:M20/M25/M40 family metallo-hydrolase n=1 Tax=uncultured Clostridium sp. TaxID=59620 RepID=UPI0028E9B9DB|nr:M20/M25/M40 family metallo-hydrolase [uncultured Clostridium sp.]
MIIIKRIVRLGTVFAIIVTLSSCSFSSDSRESSKNNRQSVESAQIQSIEMVPSTKEIVNTLCADEFQGRLIGSEGNEKAGEYIEKIFKNIGLDPYFDGSYYQKYYQKVNSTYRGERNNDKLKMVNNVVGFIKGKDSGSAVVISAHFDHIGYVDSNIIRGALDNSSGVSALIKIAHELKEKSKEKPFDMDIIFCAFNGEETGLSGSRAFVDQVNNMYYSMYNVNIDSIGAKEGGKLALKNKSKVSNKLYDAVKTTFKKNNIIFADNGVLGTSDHASFENRGIPNIYIVQENINELIHKPTDIPDILDYEQIDKVANALCDFIETNNGVIFLD